MGSNYRVVNIPILTSPCRKCSEGGFACPVSNNCQKLKDFGKACDEQVTGYGVSTPDGSDCREYSFTF